MIFVFIAAPSYNVLKSISMTLWEIMQNGASSSIQKSLNAANNRRAVIDSPAGSELSLSIASCLCYQSPMTGRYAARF